MQTLLDVILPVFLVIGFGYVAVWRGLFPVSGIDGVMKFTQNFAIPCLLFQAIARIDLSSSYDPRLLGSFYGGAALCFALGILGARLLFRRDWEDSVAIGFCCLFSNSVLLGLPITERAYGMDALTANYAIIALHSPFCYGVGITVMEMVRARGTPLGQVVKRVFKAMFSNSMIIGIGLGLVVNLTGLPLPGPLWEGLELIGRAALPAALFGLGGVLVQYRPEGDLRLIACVIVLTLGLHPAITYGLTQTLSLPTEATRSAVITASVAPGINAYLFANMYDRAKRVVASSVLLATGLTVLTAWLWLGLLP